MCKASEAKEIVKIRRPKLRVCMWEIDTNRPHQQQHHHHHHHHSSGKKHPRKLNIKLLYAAIKITTIVHWIECLPSHVIVSISYTTSYMSSSRSSSNSNLQQKNSNIIIIIISTTTNGNSVSRETVVASQLEPYITTVLPHKHKRTTYTLPERASERARER